jgi:signal transduction histidine kinase
LNELLKVITSFSSDPYPAGKTTTLIHVKIFDYLFIKYMSKEEQLLLKRNSFLEKELIAKNRELEIETSLETVRAKAMAMQASADLKEVVKTLFEELRKLDVNLQACLIATFDPVTSDQRSWMIHRKTNQPYSFLIRCNEQPFYQEMLNAWKERNTNWSHMLEGEAKRKWENFLFNDTDFKLLPEDVKEEMSKPKKVFFAASYYQYGAIQASSPELLSDASIDILQRFSKVFDSCYTRFLDLKKAESQAREAQIQLALERVRARTMAMQKSDELSETVFVLFEQFKELGEHPDQATIGTINEDEKVIEYWVTMYGQPINKVFKFSIDEPNVTGKIYKAWKEHKKSLVIDLRGKALSEFMEYRSGKGGAAINPDEKRRIINVAFFSKGLLNVQSNKERLEESIRLLERFASVFEQTYTRFLDLQKAEAQVREAQIQLALERVRAKTMAMQKPSEFVDVINIIGEQFMHLGFDFDWVNFSANGLDVSKAIDIWNFVVVPGLYQGATRLIIPFFEHPVFLQAEESVKEYYTSGNSFTVVLLDKKDKDTFLDHLFTNTIYKDLPEEVKRSQYNREVYQTSNVVLKDTWLSVGKYDATPLAAEQIGILKRLANEFGQAYTRFLDLQKAEEQAREARIEAALESVRASSMAMHHSDELENVVKTLAEKLVDLGISLDGALIFFFDKENRAYNLWIATNQLPAPLKVNYPYEEAMQANPIIQDLWKAIETGADFLNKSYAGDVKNDYFRFTAKHNANIPEEVKKIQQEAQNWTFSFTGGKHSVIGIDSWHGKVITADEFLVLKRFATVFEQAYTRFLDLQKAEAQAREAQIEAALERVRSRAMGMQMSEELNALIGTVFTELTKLDLILTRCVIEIYEGSEKGCRWWMANSEAPATPMNFFVKYANMPFFNEYLKGWDNRSLKWQYILKGDNKIKTDDFLFNETDLSHLPVFVIEGMRAPDRVYLNASFNNFGNLTLASLEPLSDEHFNIMLRFAKVFDLTYTRFNDLKQAEAQAREAKIQLALERVRAKTMAMHSSEGVSEATTTMFSELEKLGIENFRGGINVIRTDRTQEVWSVSNLTGGKSVKAVGIFRIDDHPFWKLMYEAWMDKKECLYYYLTGKEKDDYVKILNTTPDYLSQPISQFPDIHYQVYFFGEGSVWTMSLEPHSEEDKQVMKRFASVFSLTFRRYRDLQKAEAQAREGRIEMALERVRSHSLAMHKSEDLKDVVSVVLEQLQQLGFVMEGGAVYIGMFNDSAKEYIQWSADPLIQTVASYKIPYNDNPMFTDLQIAKESVKDTFFKKYSFNEKNKWFKWAFKHSDFKLLPEQFKKILLECESYSHWAAFQKNSAIIVNNILDKSLSQEQIDILKRFAKVFEQSYIRFLDLQKVEAQAREARIEASLERVRGKAMAMHSSQDLSDTIGTFYQELKSFSLTPMRCGVGLLDKEERIGEMFTWNTTEQGEGFELAGRLKMEGHNVLNNIYENWLKQREYHPVLGGDEIKEYYKVLKPQIDFPDNTRDDLLFGYFFFFQEGGVYAWTDKEMQEDELQIYRRFTSVLSLTYKRYRDLEKAESNAKEAVKQAALDRIRADIASMRTITDLDRITPLIWNELTILGVAFIRCGVFIMDDEQQQIHTFLSTPEGKGIAAFHLPYNTPGNIAHVITHWQKKEIYTDHWDEEAFKEFADNLVKQGAMKTSEQYLSTMPARGFNLHFVPFQQGMLYVGNIAPLGKEEIDLLQSIADAFSTAYARYEDFNKLEAAKKQVDKTLVELKQTQQQLVQSEKMASLGELTAGIAHEIQNPLNFVNNFSDVNSELIGEMEIELQNGNVEEAIAIANDIKENEEKINHHGKRADAIVKGMLQHSRKNAGQKELTDINALADEYFRLSFHGLRAKDKSFNATIETDFNQSIGKINVIPQDIGRVLLNLFNNAFYAVNEQKSKNHISYEPTVSVTTKMIDNKVEIKVKDNGSGIPQKVMDKIFQPFFTTKPTGQGTGLGLSLSYDIIKAHGGEIKVESKEGEGTVFIIQLPV